MNKEAVYLYGFFKGKGLPLAMKAVTYAYNLHEGQMRADHVTPYSDHPITVARLLVNQNIIDDVTLAAALLHDTIEEHKITFEGVKKEFGEEVANLVEILGDKGLERISQDIRTIIIKAADRTYNIGTMVGVFSIERLERYVRETEEKILPIMKDARRKYLLYSDALISFRDHIVNVIKVVKEVARLSRENEELKGKLSKKEARVSAAKVSYKK